MMLFGHSSRVPQLAASHLPVLRTLLFFAGAIPFLSGCAGGSPNLARAGTYDISGTITLACNGAGATLNLSGSATAFTTAGNSGNYSFAGLSNGTYMVTPSLTGYSFTPAVQTITISGANVSSVNFSGSQQPAHSVALSWSASSSVVSGYNIYRGISDGGPYNTKLNSVLITTVSYTDNSVCSGNTYYYVATAVDSADVEGTFSNQVTASIP